ncbi:MAG: hypothetical protein Q9195_004173 [Heterodermia aff. obscurata]
MSASRRTQEQQFGSQGTSDSRWYGSGNLTVPEPAYIPTQAESGRTMIEQTRALNPRTQYQQEDAEEFPRQEAERRYPEEVELGEAEQSMQQGGERPKLSIEIPRSLDQIYGSDSKKARARAKLIRDAEDIRQKLRNGTSRVEGFHVLLSRSDREIISQCKKAVREDKSRDRDRRE